MHPEGGFVISLSGDLEGEGEVHRRSKATKYFGLNTGCCHLLGVQSCSPFLLLVLGHNLYESFKQLMDHYRGKKCCPVSQFLDLSPVTDSCLSISAFFDLICW